MNQTSVVISSPFDSISTPAIAWLTVLTIAVVMLCACTVLLRRGPRTPTPDLEPIGPAVSLSRTQKKMKKIPDEFADEELSDVGPPISRV